MDDLVVRDVRIIDGSGGPSVSGDVAEKDGRIRAVGGVTGPAAIDVPGEGLCLTPGFVDAHTHDDGALLRHPDMWFKSSQGVTTVITGNCGMSAASSTDARWTLQSLFLSDPLEDIDAYRGALERSTSAINALPLIGHNTIRERVMGMEERPASPKELDAMRAIVQRSMQQGACGMSTGLIYAPGKWAPTEEVLALAQEVAVFDGIYASHMRDEYAHLLEAVSETLAIGAGAGIGVQISHHKAAISSNWGKVAESLAMIDAAVAGGQDITLDVYPYIAGSGPLAQYFRDEIDMGFAAGTQVSGCPPYPEYEGRMLFEIAETEGRTVEETIRRIVEGPGGELTVCLTFLLSEDDLETNLRHPRVMIGSDGIPRFDGKPHPRLVGTFPRTLGEYVRDRGIVPLEEMIRRMTSLPARRFGLAGRGLIAPDHHADLVLLDADRVRDRATYEEPLELSEGIEMVLVSGVPVWSDGADTGRRPGSLLRYRRA